VRNGRLGGAVDDKQYRRPYQWQTRQYVTREGQRQRGRNLSGNQPSTAELAAFPGSLNKNQHDGHHGDRAGEQCHLCPMQPCRRIRVDQLLQADARDSDPRKQGKCAQFQTWNSRRCFAFSTNRSHARPAPSKYQERSRNPNPSPAIAAEAAPALQFF